MDNTKKKRFELSSAQKRIYYEYLLNLDAVNYNMPMAFNINEEVSITRLENIFRIIINRHDSLHTVFHIINGKLVQEVLTDVPFSIEICTKDKMEEFIKPFDLGKAPLMRVGILKKKNGRNVLICDIHHIISDAYSLSIICKEFMELYTGYTLEDQNVQYVDYVKWHNNFLKSEAGLISRDFWTNMLSGELPLLNLMTDKHRPKVKSVEGDNYILFVEKELLENLRIIAKRNMSTMNILMSAAYTILLFKYSSQSDLIVGSVAAGRSKAQFQNVLGMFVNTLAIRYKVQEELTFSEYLAYVRDLSLACYENQNYPFDELVNYLKVKRDPGRNPLFDVMFSYQNSIGSVSNNILQINLEGIATNTAKFDISMVVEEFEDNLKITIEYSKDLYESATIKRFGEHYIKVLKKIVYDNNILISDINMLTQGEQESLQTFNKTECKYQDNITVVDLFEEQVKMNSYAIAVLTNGKKITYGEINNKINHLAHILRKKNVNANTIVPIIMERSIEMIIGIMAILKAGGAYLPIDPAYPKKRIEFILKDSESSVILSTESLLRDIEFNGYFIDLYMEQFNLQNTENLLRTNDANDICYVIYTSGTTGNPKGVKVTHKNLYNFICSFRSNFDSGFSSKDIVLSLTNYVFDVSVCEFFISLTSGSTLIINDSHVTFDPKIVADMIKNFHVTFTYIPPSLLPYVYQYLKDYNTKIPLNKLLVGVEPIKESVICNYYNLNPDLEIINGYGPTEATICTTFYKVRPLNNQKDLNESISIGKPLHNAKIYILDKNLSLLPICVPGNLYISGDCLSPGYLNNDELTRQKFIDNPYEPGEKMYHTGDIARWIPNGNIEFLGRMDSQVKIRGYRIELEEIRNCIIRHEDIKDAYVLCKKKDKDIQLYAYIISSKTLEELEVKNYLKKYLVEYMIPSTFIQIEKFPLTANGKIAVELLPEPAFYGDAVKMEMPHTPTQKILFDIWKVIMEVDVMGINSNFFSLGGHSLKAIEMITALNNKLQRNLNLQDIFKYQTIKELAEYIDSSNHSLFERNHENIILLKKAENKENAKNLFLIHDGTGDISGYTRLITKLGSNISCWGIMLDKKKWLPKSSISIKILSATYIKLIKSIPTVNHFSLAGWSLGGVIAFEMVRQLEEQAGNVVEQLIMIDSYIKIDDMEQVKIPKDLSIGNEMKSIIQYFNHGVIKDRILKKLNLEKQWNIAVSSASETEINQLKINMKKQYQNPVIDWENMELLDFVEYINIVQKLFYSLFTYQPESKIKKNAVFFKAKNNILHSYYKWKDLFETELTIYEIEGNHYSILQENALMNLAVKINELLKP